MILADPKKARINGSELLTKMQFSFFEIQGWFNNETSGNVKIHVLISEEM